MVRSPRVSRFSTMTAPQVPRSTINTPIPTIAMPTATVPKLTGVSHHASRTSEPYAQLCAEQDYFPSSSLPS